MQGFPGDLLARLPVYLAAVPWAFYWGARSVVVVQGWVRERKGGRREDEEPHLELRQSIDLTLTGAFDQLRRDLQSTIERAHHAGQKETENAMQRFLLELELLIQGLNRDEREDRERRRRPRS